MHDTSMAVAVLFPGLVADLEEDAAIDAFGKNEPAMNVSGSQFTARAGLVPARMEDPVMVVGIISGMR